MVFDLNKLTDKNDLQTYEYARKLLVLSVESNELYQYFDDFVSLLEHHSSYVRTRGFN